MAGEFGYTGKILRMDLSSGKITHQPTSDYSGRFIGGRGIAAKIHWDEVPPQVGALDPENRLTFITGPMAGISGVAGSRWQICGKTPATEPEHFGCCNLGGRWGAELKFAGYDGIVIQGRSDRPVYLLLQEGRVEIRDAGSFWGKTTIETRINLKAELGDSAYVVTTGPAGENLVRTATIFAENDANSSSFGAVMGSKNLKAIVLRGEGKRPKIADPDRFRELSQYAHSLKPDGARGYFHFMSPAPQTLPPTEKTRPMRCYGCTSGCARISYRADNGEEGKFYCQAANFSIRRARSYYGVWNDAPFLATRLCDKYGLNTGIITPMLEWLARCYKAGILTEESTGIPLSKLGSLEFMETLVRKIALREGFGDVLAQGIYKAADIVGGNSRELITDYACHTGQIANYGPRIYIATALLYATEPWRPTAQLHHFSKLAVKWMVWANGGVADAYMTSQVFRAIAKRFWGSESAADFSTYEGKALAAKRIQEREHAQACLILCETLWPLMDSEHTEDHLGDPTLENRLYSAVTGNELDEEGFLKHGERIFNLQRAILVREGHWGRQDDRLEEFNYTVPIQSDAFNPECQVPGKDGEPMSRKGAVVDRQKFEGMLEEYYQLRHWDVATGLQSKSRLEQLGLGDIAADLEPRGLVR